MALRDHEPIIIEEFGGWWNRGDAESCPTDHFNQADNIQYLESGVENRDPLDKYQLASIITDKVLRTYDYVTQTGQTLLVLVEGGIIHHVVNPNVVHLAILTIPAMEDFAFVAIAGRAYISPFHTLTDANGQNYEIGLLGEFLYVYAGDGTPARKAGGPVPTNGGLKPFIAFNDINDGIVTRGVHVIAISFENNGFGPRTTVGGFYILPILIAPGGLKIQLNNLPIPGVGVTQRKILMTRALDPGTYFHGMALTFYEAAIIFDNTVVTKLIDIKDDDLVTVYAGSGTTFPVLSGAMMVTGSTILGFVDTGFHLVGVVYETSTGYLSSPGPEYYAANSYVDPTKKVTVYNIPTSTDPIVVKRHLVSTKAIQFYNGDQKGYQFFFVPGGTLNDNTTTKLDVSYYDSDLVADASHLMDNFVNVPAGVALNTYHSRLVLVGDATIPDPATLALSANRVRSGENRVDNRSVAWVSAPGEPEAFNQVDGIIIVPLDGNPLTNCQEFRDQLYLYKKTRTYGYVDNMDEPATWQEKVVDEGIGTSVHGIATVLDSGGVNVDFLLSVDLSGLMLFNGTYSRPEISWKIEDFWLTINRNGLRYIQISNDSLAKRVYITLPPPRQNYVLYADYSDGLDPKNVAWARWIFDAKITSVCLINTNKLVLGAELDYPGIYFINPLKSTNHDSYNGGIELKIPNPTIRTAYLGE